MIQGGYHIRQNVYPDWLKHASPCAREVWGYVISFVNFESSKHTKRGQMLRSYNDIREALYWYNGPTKVMYSIDQIKGAFKLFRAHGEMETKRKGIKVLITYCRYEETQDKKNYSKIVTPPGYGPETVNNCKKSKVLHKSNAKTEHSKTSTETRTFNSEEPVTPSVPGVQRNPESPQVNPESPHKSPNEALFCNKESIVKSSNCENDCAGWNPDILSTETPTVIIKKPTPVRHSSLYNINNYSFSMSETENNENFNDNFNETEQDMMPEYDNEFEEIVRQYEREKREREGYSYDPDEEDLEANSDDLG